MAASAALVIDVIVNTSKAQGQMAAAGGKFSKFGAGIGKLAAPAGAVVVGLAAAGAASVKSASDMQQAFGGLDAVFGANAATVKDWANNAAGAVGLSASEYAGFAGKIGASLKNAGVPMDQIAGQTDEMIKLGADLAATYGGTTSEAVDALGASLRGEADPAERYGLSLNQAAVNAKMAADGTDKLTGKAKTQAKAQATLALATEQAGGAIGQFGRESGSAAGSAQIAAAQFENAKAALGTALLPIVAKVATAFGQMAGFVQKNATAFQILAVVIGVLATAILIMAAAQWVANLAMAAFPGTWIALAIIAVIVAIVILWKKCDAFRNAVLAVWRAGVAAFHAIVGAVRAVPAAVQAANAMIAAAFRAAWNAIKAVVGAVINWIRGKIAAHVAAARAAGLVVGAAFRAAWNAIRSAVGAALAWITAKVRAFANANRAAANMILAAFRQAWNTIKATAASMVASVVARFRSLMSTARSVIASIRSAFSSGWSAIRSAASSAMSSVLSALRRPVSAAISAANQIKSAFTSAFARVRSAASGLTGALTAPFHAISGAISNAIGAVQNLIGALSRIRVPSVKIPSIGKAAPAAASGRTLTTAPRAGVQASTGRTGARAGTSGGIVVNVNGALDPDAVARQIERILTGAQRRRSGVVMGQRALGVAR